MINQQELETFGPSLQPSENVTYEQAKPIVDLCKSVGISGVLGIHFTAMMNGTSNIQGGQIQPLMDIKGDYTKGAYKFVFIASGPRPAGVSQAEYDAAPPVMLCSYILDDLNRKSGTHYLKPPFEVVMGLLDTVAGSGASSNYNPMLVQDTRALVVAGINATYPRPALNAPPPPPPGTPGPSVTKVKK